MPDKHESKRHGGPLGHGGGNKHEGQDGEIGQHVDTTPDSTDQSKLNRGGSESSPGHLKKEAGATSARDYAPGHARSQAGIAEVAPDEIGEES